MFAPKSFTHSRSSSLNAQSLPKFFGAFYLFKAMWHLIRHPIIYFKLVRATFILWLLDTLTYEEKIPLCVYGQFVAHEGDIAIINDPSLARIQVGKVVSTIGVPPTVHIRLYRRPRG
jgi:hypothetical protein